MNTLRRSAVFLTASLAVACAPKPSTTGGAAIGTATTLTTLPGGSTTLDGSAGVDTTTVSSSRLAVGTQLTFHLQDAPPEGVTSVMVTIASVEALVVTPEVDVPPGETTTASETTSGADSTTLVETTAAADTTTSAETTVAPDTTTSEVTTTGADTTTETLVSPSGGEVDDALLDPADDDGPGVWLSLPVQKVVDLVAHQGEGAAELLGDVPLPVGKVTKLRLLLDVSLPGNNTITYGGGVTCQLNTDKVEKKGIRINKVFKAFESKTGSKGEVWLDFDLAESLKEDKQGDCWKLEPVLKLHKVKLDGQEQQL
jgi:hypothetical protein